MRIQKGRSLFLDPEPLPLLKGLIGRQNDLGIQALQLRGGGHGVPPLGLRLLADTTDLRGGPQQGPGEILAA